MFVQAHEGLIDQKTDERKSLPVGDEHILYVDDEPSILDITRSDPDKFDLLITDIAIPNMTGDQLVIETLKYVKICRRLYARVIVPRFLKKKLRTLGYVHIS